MSAVDARATALGPAGAGASAVRLRVQAGGAVQGMGLRPFVHRLAGELGLPGWVRNSGGGIEIEVEGPRERLEDFLSRLHRDKPPGAAWHALDHAFLERAGFERFEIRASCAENPVAGRRPGAILPDFAACADCLREVFDPANRRFRYPFTHCTQCGPRYSIIESLPYDRPNTTLRGFALCPACRGEFEDPRDRRFHAQAIACPACGPQLEWRDGSGGRRGRGDAALHAAAALLRGGGIVALKGVGGFQLLCDARDPAAVARLRERKRRGEKPFALMVETLAAAQELCETSPEEEGLLGSREAPIVLLRARRTLAREDWRVASAGPVCDAIAPGTPLLGVMLPASPLHRLLMRALGFPVVATSGNLSEEPICFDDGEAIERLGAVADAFLAHDRPIARGVDDSIVRMIAGQATLLRRARGHAPLQVAVDTPLKPVLAAGAHQKNTIAITASTGAGGGVVLSQHIGDLDGALARAALDRTRRDIEALHGFQPRAVACDAHPDYASSAYARTLGLALVAVQHHYAHVLSCMADNGVCGPVLGIAWDGAGWGPDGTLWGGEFLRVSHDGSWKRLAHLRGFALPGGALALREPRRAALGLAFEIFGAALPPQVACLFEPSERRALLSLLRAGIHSPRTSSAGRLFDAVAACAGLRSRASYEGQAAMQLEFAADGETSPDAYRLPLAGALLDWEPLFRALLDDLASAVALGRIAAKFHNALARGMVEVALRAACARVVLSGGCFQNARLTECAVQALETAGFEVLRHRQVPPNDGGIALGQAIAAGKIEK